MSAPYQNQSMNTDVSGDSDTNTADEGSLAKLTRRQVLKRTGPAAAAFAICGPAWTLLSNEITGTAQAAATIVWNHNPASPIGPLHWGSIGFPTCGQGTSQSPVDIWTNSVTAYPGTPLLLSYEPSALMIENTGHYVEIPIPPSVHNTLQFGGESYELVQYHFHAPSEHAINGQLADLEAHFVYMTAQGAELVVGILFSIGSQPNALLDHILLSAPLTAGEEAYAGEASPAELFQHIKDVSANSEGLVHVNSFYDYGGSLTTPGCTQGLRWLLLADGGYVSHAALTRYHEIISRLPNYDGYPNNNRPLQPLNGRTISLRRN